MFLRICRKISRERNLQLEEKCQQISRGLTSMQYKDMHPLYRSVQECVGGSVMFGRVWKTKWEW